MRLAGRIIAMVLAAVACILVVEYVLRFLYFRRRVFFQPLGGLYDEFDPHNF